MKLTFLGTAAALYMTTPESELKEGQRRCSSMLIDDNILVDIPLHAVDFAKKIGIDLTKITDVLLTHSHNDHFWKEVLVELANIVPHKLNFYCHKGAVENLELSESDKEAFNLIPLEDMDKIVLSDATVTTYPANHMTKGDEQPLHYVIEKGGKSVFYGCDGGMFVAKTWETLRKTKLNAAVLDATVGDDAGNFRIGTHNSTPMLRIINAALIENGVMDENGKRIASHLAPFLYKTVEKGVKRVMTEEELRASLAELGMITAYDGFEIEI